MNASTNPETKAVMGMAADTIGKSLLGALLTEIRLLPDVWPKLSEHKQKDVIDRLRTQVETNVRMAVHLINARGRTTIQAECEQVTVKDGIKAVFTCGRNNESRHSLFDSQGKTCLIVVADAEDHLGGMDEIKAEKDQRSMDLGHEYHQNDGGGMPGSPPQDGPQETLALTDKREPIDVEPESDDDALYDDAVTTVRNSGKCSISEVQRVLQIGYNRAARLIEQMELAGVVSAPNSRGERKVLPESKKPNDHLYEQALQTVMARADTKNVQAEHLQDAIKCSKQRAEKLLERLQEAGIVSEADDAGVRTILAEPEAV